MLIWHLQRFPQHVFIIPAFIALVSLTGLIAGMGSEIEKRTRREVSESLSSPETSLVILPGGVSCQSITNLDGTKIQLLPKLIFVIQSHLGLSVQHLICRLPDCYKSPCTNGNCEETNDGHRCVCPQGSIGGSCEMIDPTTTTSATITNRPSMSSPIQDATTLSASEFISTQITTTSISSNAKIFVTDIGVVS
ncbi:uncharacterized protein LOC121414940 [Lytechinus variegatus]|uniref:uncharacterized protein LOC121414940 n=1 Tax=Lytechinus variegatus TaxID=7654 RepID=UPI001BB11036|nr:uncharacterized protein LOC121414940 [Lytechinus variegatus]